MSMYSYQTFYILSLILYFRNPVLEISIICIIGNTLIYLQLDTLLSSLSQKLTVTAELRMGSSQNGLGFLSP